MKPQPACQDTFARLHDRVQRTDSAVGLKHSASSGCSTCSTMEARCHLSYQKLCSLASLRQSCGSAPDRQLTSTCHHLQYHVFTRVLRLCQADIALPSIVCVRASQRLAILHCGSLPDIMTCMPRVCRSSVQREAGCVADGGLPRAGAAIAQHIGDILYYARMQAPPWLTRSIGVPLTVIRGRHAPAMLQVSCSVQAEARPA